MYNQKKRKTSLAYRDHSRARKSYENFFIISLVLYSLALWGMIMKLAFE